MLPIFHNPETPAEGKRKLQGAALWLAAVSGYLIMGAGSKETRNALRAVFNISMRER